MISSKILSRIVEERKPVVETGKKAQEFHCIRFEQGRFFEDGLELIIEEPLLIRVQQKPYSVVMRTPGEEIAHAAGFCLGEGLVASPDDFLSIGYCQDLDPNVIEVQLSSKRREKVAGLLERRGFVSQTSCGICGKELLEDLHQVVQPVENDLQLEMKPIFACLKALYEHQSMYPKTRGTHAALILDDHLEPLSFAEDVGRHNALDKVIGEAFLRKRLDRPGPVVLSSRISFELVQKAARARLPLLLSKSRPTALAVSMAQSLNMTLVCISEEGKAQVLCGEQRIQGCS